MPHSISIRLSTLILICIALNLSSCNNRYVKINGISTIMTLRQSDSILKCNNWVKCDQLNPLNSNVIFVYYKTSDCVVENRVFVKNDSLLFYSLSLKIIQDSIQSVSYFSENNISFDEAVLDAIMIYDRISTVHGVPKIDNLNRFKTHRINYLDISALPVAVWHVDSRVSVSITISVIGYPDNIKKIYLTELLFKEK